MLIDSYLQSEKRQAAQWLLEKSLKTFLPDPKFKAPACGIGPDRGDLETAKTAIAHLQTEHNATPEAIVLQGRFEELRGEPSAALGHYERAAKRLEEYREASVAGVSPTRLSTGSELADDLGFHIARAAAKSRDFARAREQLEQLLETPRHRKRATLALVDLDIQEGAPKAAIDRLTKFLSSVENVADEDVHDGPMTLTCTNIWPAPNWPPGKNARPRKQRKACSRQPKQRPRTIKTDWPPDTFTSMFWWRGTA